MPLTQEQQLLLHAWADGECGTAEAALATRLLEDAQTREQARAYLRDIRRLRVLVADCGKVRAPAGLQGRVLAAVKAEGRGRVMRPRFGAALVTAAAAALLLTVGIMLGTQGGDVADTQQVATGSADLERDTQGQAAPRLMPAPDTSDDVKSKLTGSIEAPPPPAGPVKPAEPEKAREKREVVRLDRGSEDAPCDVVVEFSRRDSVHQAYTDLLMLASLHGRAELVESRPDPTFAGHDFGAYEHVRVEIPERLLPELLSSVNSMTRQQQYGVLWIPDDLRQTAANIAVRSETLSRKGSMGPWMPMALQESMAGQPAGSAYRPTQGPERNMLIHIKLR